MNARTMAPLLVAAVAAVASLPLLSSLTVAQTGTGTVSGRVTWNACIRGIYPYGLGAATGASGAATEVMPPAPTDVASSGSAQLAPGAPGMPVPAPGAFPAPPRAIPAGAVVVAVQGTSLNALTDQNGQFSLSGVPSGQYLTIAAGPVPAANNAWAMQPNVLVGAGQSVSVGVLTLGSMSPAPGCFPYGAGMAVPDAAQSPASGAPADAAPTPAAP